MGKVSDSNVRLPSDDEFDDENECHICEDDNTAIVLKGSYSKPNNVFGNEIVLCQFCFSELVQKANTVLGN